MMVTVEEEEEEELQIHPAPRQQQQQQIVVAPPVDVVVAPPTNVLVVNEKIPWKEKLEKCEIKADPFVPLLVDHCMKWHLRKIPSISLGIYVSETMATWILCSRAFIQSGKLRDDPRTLHDFPLVKIPQFLVYSRDTIDEYGRRTVIPPVPITRMPMYEFMQTVEGLEWIVFGDLRRVERSREWWRQIMTLFQLVIIRAFYFTQGEFDATLLDSPEYCDSFEVDVRTYGRNELGVKTDVDDAELEESRKRYQSDDEEDKEEEEDQIKKHSDLVVYENPTSLKGKENMKKKAITNSGGNDDAEMEEVERKREEDEDDNSDMMKRVRERVERARKIMEQRKQQTSIQSSGGGVLSKKRVAASAVAPSTTLKENALSFDVIDTKQKKKRMKRIRDEFGNEVIVTIGANGERVEEIVDDRVYKLTKATVNAKWIFDIDTITSLFWIHAFQHETTVPPQEITEDIDLGYFRAWLFGRVISQTEFEVVKFRRVWREDIIVTESMKRIYIRKNPMDTRPKSRSVIVTKNDNFHEVICTSIESICDQNADNHNKRISTDAMFFMQAQALKLQGGYFINEIYKKGFREAEDLCIYRDPILNAWIVHFTWTERYWTTSFTGAFYYMRKKMREKGMHRMKNGCDLSIWDSHFEKPK